MAVNTSNRVQTEVHRSICTFFVFPVLQGCVSPQGVQDNVQENPRFKANIAGEFREAELIPKGCSAGSRGDGIAGVPSLGALSVTCSPTPDPAPDQGPPSVSHLVPTVLLYKSYFTAQ